MSTWLSVWSWLKKYWYIPVFTLGSVALWLLFRRTGMPFDQVLTELKSIQAKSDIDKLKAEIGTEKAKMVVVEKYKAELQALDAKQKEQANELQNNPAELAKFLVRASSKRSNK